MVQPIDYNLNVKSPFEMAMYGRGQALQQNIMEQQLEAARQQEAARQKEAQATAAMRADFAAFAEKKDKTDNDYRGMMEKYPDMAKNIDMAFANKTAEQKRNTLDQSLPIRAALKNNNPEKAIEQVINLAAAQRNSGFEDQAQKTEAMISTIKGSPEGALDSINMTIARIDPDLYKRLMEQDTAEKELKIKQAEQNLKSGKQKAELVKMGIESGLKKQQTLKTLKETEKLGIETQKAALELKRLEQQGAIDPKEKFNQEEKIRKEYQSRSKSLTEARDAFSKIDISSKDKSGASDTALIFSFMKMLDPGSVVREGEFAQARDTAGLMTTLMNSLKKVQSGEFLTDKQRQKFASLSKKYLESGEKQNLKIRKGYDKLITDYKLDPEHIFGEMSESQQTGQTNLVEGTRILSPQEQQQLQQGKRKTVVKRGIQKSTGRTIIQYSDGTIEYAD